MRASAEAAERQRQGGSRGSHAVRGRKSDTQRPGEKGGEERGGSPALPAIRPTARLIRPVTGRGPARMVMGHADPVVHLLDHHREPGAHVAAAGPGERRPGPLITTFRAMIRITWRGGRRAQVACEGRGARIAGRVDGGTDTGVRSSSQWARPSSGRAAPQGPGRCPPRAGRCSAPPAGARHGHAERAEIVRASSCGRAPAPMTSVPKRAEAASRKNRPIPPITRRPSGFPARCSPWAGRWWP